MTTPAIQAVALKLAPSAGRVGAILAEAARNPQRRVSAAIIKQLHAQLADDLRKIEAACVKVAKGDWPEDFSDVNDYGRALQVARLAVFGAATDLAAITLLDSGSDPEVFRVLGRALSSAMTSSGVEAKKLNSPPLTSNTPEPVDQEFRARLVCLAELVQDDNNQLKKLYGVAAKKYGWERKKARQIVANALGGKLKDDTFLQLRKYWKPRLEAEIRAGKKASELL